MLDLPLLFATLTSLTFIYLYHRFGVLRKVNPAKLPLPPGPPRKPLIGNALEMTSRSHWFQATEWAKQYGDIFYVEALGQPTIYINDAKIANDLLEKRSSIYSDRGDAPMNNDLCGHGWNFAFMRYGDGWRLRRKIFHREFNIVAVQSFRPTQTRHIYTMARSLHRNPDGWHQHLRRLATAVVMNTSYGIEIQDEDDIYVKTAHEAIEYISRAGTPGAWLVDSFPLLKYIPPWFPGAEFQRLAKKWKPRISEMADAPFKAAREAFDTGSAPPSLARTWLEKIMNDPNAENRENMLETLRGVTGTSFVGGFETTSTSLTDFILAMLLYPEVQRKGQDELDRVVGNRMPEWNDLPDLPYINAMHKELLRWRPVVPLGVPHKSIKEDEYNGFYIPKGCLIINNAWAMLRNEAVYGPEPDKFMPERFLDPNVPYPIEGFGFGRRICPGRHLADNTILLGISIMLRLFHISKKTDVNGNAIEPEVEWSVGFLLHPHPFECDIRIRDPGALELLQPL